MKTAFPALIKSISVKSLCSGDKEGEIRLRFLPTDEVMDALQRLHRADEEVMVGIVEIVEQTIKNNAIHKRKERKSEGTQTGGEV
jgi:hypothetical protein